MSDPQPRPGRVGFVVTLVFATFFMGSSFIATKLLLQQGFPPVILAGGRFLVAALATLPVLFFVDGRPLSAALLPARAGLRDAALVAVIGLVQTAAVMGLLFVSMQFISPSTAAILLFTNPIWVALLSRLFLGESLHRGKLAGFVLGVVGVALALGLSPNTLTGGAELRGGAIALGAALCWAFGTLINKRAGLPFGSWALTFWQMLIGSLALLLIAYLQGQRWPDAVTHAQWGWFLWLAIPASTGSFGLWFVALSKGGATSASSYLFLAPLFAVVLSFAILGSTLTWLQATGGALVGLALWLVNRAAAPS